jgi:hypothetical protein
MSMLTTSYLGDTLPSACRNAKAPEFSEPKPTSNRKAPHNKEKLTQVTILHGVERILPASGRSSIIYIVHVFGLPCNMASRATHLCFLASKISNIIPVHQSIEALESKFYWHHSHHPRTAYHAHPFDCYLIFSISYQHCKVCGGSPGSWKPRARKARGGVGELLSGLIPCVCLLCRHGGCDATELQLRHAVKTTLVQCLLCLQAFHV